MIHELIEILKNTLIKIDQIIERTKNILRENERLKASYLQLENDHRKMGYENRLLKRENIRLRYQNPLPDSEPDFSDQEANDKSRFFMRR